MIGGMAVAGGALRIAAAFLAGTSIDSQLLQQIYFVTDFALVLGTGGYYASKAARLDASGLAVLPCFCLEFCWCEATAFRFGARG
jgi:hypothetical protein